jgi:hypothetical protein
MLRSPHYGFLEGFAQVYRSARQEVAQLDSQPRDGMGQFTI